MLKPIELYALSGCIVWYVNYVSTNLLFFFFLILTELDLVKKYFHFGKEADFIVITSSQPNPFAYFTWGLV